MPPQFTLRRGRCPVRYPNRIRDHRLRSNLTQRDLAKRVGGSRGMISAWEHGYVLPTALNLFRLAHAINVSCEDLYPGLATPDPEQDQPAA